MRWVVGLLLVSAAALKFTHLLAEPAVVLTGQLGRFVVPLQIAAELSIGIFALLNLFWRQLRWLALIVFIGFAAYSYRLAISGTASCGCFGPIEVHPWWTFALDAAVATGLLLSIFVGADEASPSVTPRRRRAWAIAIIGLSFAGAAVLGWYATPVQTASLVAVGDLVILEPEDWVGKRLPIAEYIDADLSKGNWILLLHRHDCPECQAAAPEYESLADAQNVALIEMPPYAGAPIDHGPALHARMPDDRQWFVQTPVEIRIKDGVVLGASTNLPAIGGPTEL